MTQRPRARDDVVFRPLDDEWMIFDPTTDRLHALNLTAALIWTSCDGQHDLAQIAADVADAFGPPAESDAVADDVQHTVARFRREGLLA